MKCTIQLFFEGEWYEEYLIDMCKYLLFTMKWFKLIKCRKMSHDLPYTGTYFVDKLYYLNCNFYNAKSTFLVLFAVL